MPTSPARPWHGRLLSTGPLVTAALITGWLSVTFLAAGSYRDIGLALAAVASGIALVTMRRGRSRRKGMTITRFCLSEPT